MAANPRIHRLRYKLPLILLLPSFLFWKSVSPPFDNSHELGTPAGDFC